MNDKDTIIRVGLIIGEWDTILSILAEHPYKDVFNAIDKVKAQAETQTDLI